MPTCAESLVNYLRELEARGETHVNVDDEARLILREFYLRARNGGAASVPVEPVREDQPVVVTDANPVQVTEQSVAPAVVSSESVLDVSGATAKDKIGSLRKQAEKWKPARDLGSLRQTMVFSVGNPEADVMLVGEAPGYDEERLHEPFVGKAGQKLNDILRAMGIDRKETYISNIVKFRPAMPNQTNGSCRRSSS